MKALKNSHQPLTGPLLVCILNLMMTCKCQSLNEITLSRKSERGTETVTAERDGFETFLHFYKPVKVWRLGGGDETLICFDGTRLAELVVTKSGCVKETSGHLHIHLICFQKWMFFTSENRRKLVVIKMFVYEVTSWVVQVKNEHKHGSYSWDIKKGNKSVIFWWELSSCLLLVQLVF